MVIHLVWGGEHVFFFFKLSDIDMDEIFDGLSFGILGVVDQHFTQVYKTGNYPVGSKIGD